MRYEAPRFTIVGDARRLVLGIGQGEGDTPGGESSTGPLVLGLDD